MHTDVGKSYVALLTETSNTELSADYPSGIPEGDEKAEMRPMSINGQELSPTDASACLAMAKAIEILGGMEAAGACSVERTSVYGAALAIPQIARSAKWPTTMCCLTIRAFLFLVINYGVQSLFIYYIYDSQTNMNPFGGQMHLCDFASHVADCPNSPNCHGPGGKEFQNPGTLYPYDIWNTRKFLRDSLMALFPDLKDEIADKVDPGEYGLEGYYCRYLCIFVFMVSIADEFQNIRDLFKLLWNLPSDESHWVQYDPPSWGPKHHVKVVHDQSELDFVQFTVNGMPRRWKVFNIVFLLIPKIFIWRMLSMAGVHFLMETAAMVDQIVNTTALSFVFSVDELLLERLTTKATKHILEKIQDLQLFDGAMYETETDQEAMQRYFAQEMRWNFNRQRDWWLLPRRLFWSVVLMLAFIWEYYFHNCRKMDDGSWVSVDMFLPLNAHLDGFCFVSKFIYHCSNVVGEAFWTMPEGSLDA